MQKTHTIQVKTGNYYVISQYDEPILYDYIKGEKKDDNPNEIDTNQRKMDSVQNSSSRAKATMKNLVKGNYKSFPASWNWRFITFTFAPKKAEPKGIDIQNLDHTNIQWKKFRQRLEYHFKQKIYYLTVHERHKSGNIHYHTIFFNIPKIRNKDLAKIWGNGFIKNKRVKDLQHALNYILKYICKDIDDSRVKGKRAYFHNLPHKPVKERDIDTIVKTIPPKEHRLDETNSEYEYKDRNGNIRKVKIKTFFVPPDYKNPHNLSS